MESNVDIGFTPQWPTPANVRAFVTTRTGGSSQNAYASNNLALHVGDNPTKVEENRLQLQSTLKLQQQPCWLNQVHGTRLVDATSQCSSKTPCSSDLSIHEADGSFIREVGVACAVLTADCLPVLMCDNQGVQVAAIHAGWRGLAAGILPKAVNAFSAPVNQLNAYLGPAISQAYFEVGAEVCEEIDGNLGLKRNQYSVPSNHSGRLMVDLYEVARLHLAALGVNEVYGGNNCTYRDENQFYSYRRDGITGRMASLIWKTS
ncbi:peptidoglycan editing factor PgeF [Aurantivibrio plasticivorans]